MTSVICWCGSAIYETSTPGVFKCSGCGEVTNDWDSEEDEEEDDVSPV